ncbi:GNAT family N-acetyltransferase [Vibrio sp. SCSIO 43132]|uniref:GNAT family N-acetyltransferase n=1 Tax=Vibrio sp. SCSIO 43132 TaxID=2779363 RepID=UPI001CA9D7BC|nr:N-acetyltransferase [Vibrio sp. SCSIO 43132]UAB71958.1 GNAT family N-acetyltransferase [Vibrio sp. SCSIO 43132]
MEIIYKELTKCDIDLHREFIYIALWDSPDEPRRSRDVLDHPKVKEYYIDWGEKDDVGIVAYIEGVAAGFIQLRVKDSITKQYSEYPELAISVLPQYQGMGIGVLMYNELLSRVKHLYPGIRLGVNPKNEVAIKFYKKLNFDFYAHPEGSYPQMVVEFKKM